MDIPEMVNGAVANVSTWVWYVAFVLLIGFGVYATIRSKGIQVTRIGEACRAVISGFKEKNGKKHVISSFQAFCVSMGMRIGIGNIVGVATAIVMGGPGAVFWMWVFSLIGAATSFVENTIGQIYKEKKGDGFFHGGPAYYVKNGLGKAKFAVFIAILFIVTYGLCFTGINANQISSTLQTAFSGIFGNATISLGGLEFTVLSLVIGILIATLTASIIFGGVRRVARASTKVVPVMAVLWLILVFIIILLNITQFPAVIATIFTYAFGAQAFIGGGIGAAVMWGLKRGVFSNEAGIGSVPSVSSSGQVNHPIKQGLMQSLGVLIDTILVCSATAFVLIIYTNQAYPAYDFAAQGLEASLAGAPLVAEALSATFLGSAAPFVLVAFIFVFSFSSIIGIYSLTESNLKFISEKKPALLLLRIVIVAMVFFSSIWSMTLAWNLADISQALVGIFNICIIIFLVKHVWIALSDYFDQKKKGIEDPVFNPSILSSQKGITCWPPEKDEKNQKE